MTFHTREAHGRNGGRRRILATLLALAILLPLGMLFLDHRRHLSEQRSNATHERHGVEYLRALGSLTTALTDAQSAAVSGEPVAREALDQALAGVAEVDDRFDDQLRVRERVSQLRETVERAASTNHPGGRAAFTSYAEATDLLLSLHDRLRETAGLVRDPDQDAYHLQDAAGGQLPATIVAVGQLVDLVTLAASEPAGAQAADPTEIVAAIAAVDRPAEDFVVAIQATLDSTQSRSLSTAVLAKYDRFLRAKDGLLATVPPDGDVADLEFGFFAMIRGELRAAGDDLQATLLTELDRLIQTRMGALARSHWTAVAAVCVGVLLVAGLVAVGLVRGARQPTHHPRQGQLTAGGADDDPGGGNGPGERREPSRPLTPISDTAAGSGARPGAPPGGDRFAGELIGSEHADVR